MAWDVMKAARAGYLKGLGRTSTEIAAEIGGVSANIVRMAFSRWGITANGNGAHVSILPVPMGSETRKQLSQCAKSQGLDPEEWLRRIAVCAIEDDLYAAVTDGRFD